MNLELNTNSFGNSLTAAAPFEHVAAPVGDTHLAMLSNADLPGFGMLDEGLKFVDLRNTSSAPTSAFDALTVPVLAA